MAMPQPLHIFRKDLMHLWPETLVTLLLFVAFAATAPSGWSSSQYAGIAVLLAGFLKLFLMPLSWLVVISRLIHDESLVGDRQFWTSRPYHWGMLLAAKILYLAAFLYLPFLLMQVYLLKHAGLYPTTAIPELLHNLLLLTVVIVVPLTAIAAVTGTFARMLLSTIGAVIYLIVVSLFLLYLVFRRMPPPGLEWVLYGLVIVLPAAVVVYQYATRNTRESRAMLIATPLLVAVLLLLTPAAAIVRQTYPAARGNDPKLGPLPAQFMPKTAPPGAVDVERGEVSLQLPLTAAGLDEKSNYTVRGAQVTIDGAGGTHWTSPYMNELATQINSYRPEAVVLVAVPLGVFEKVKDAPADVHLSLPAEHLRLEDATTWHSGKLPFSVPGHGVCSYAPDDSAAAFWPTCRFPFSTPDLNLVTAKLAAAGGCSAGAAQRTPRQMNLVAGPATLDFDPVLSLPMNFRNPMQQGPPERLTLCPGSELEFTQAKVQGKMRFEVDLKGIMLDPLVGRVRGQTPGMAEPEQ